MKKPSKDFESRRKRAEEFRDKAKEDIRECLAFISPGRERDFDGTYPLDRENEEREVLMSLAEDLAQDFAGDLVSYFCPAEATWHEYLVTAPVPEDVVEQVQEIVGERENEIEEIITGSNFNDISPQVFFEANHGTIAMWCEQSHFAQNMYCETVTPDELLILPGHMGILDRFRDKQTSSDLVKPALQNWDGVDLESDIALARKLEKIGLSTTVCWGFWVDWTDPGNPKWMYEITVDKKCVMADGPQVLGPLEGACPLLVGRFNPQKRTPWGRGPAMKALPECRVANQVDESVMEGLDQTLTNTLIYAKDGTLDLSGGLVPGQAYAASRTFDRNKIWEMQRGVNLDTGFITEDRLEARLRSCFYQDGPRQTGDTPPTSTQWIDERRRVQQRIGKPSAPIWREFLLPFIQRVEYIGVETGKFEAEITHDEKAITVIPQNPLKRAQNQDEVMTARANLDMAAGVFGEAVNSFVDPVATFRNVVERSGDRITIIRKQQLQDEGPTDGPTSITDGPGPAV